MPLAPGAARRRRLTRLSMNFRHWFFHHGGDHQNRNIPAHIGVGIEKDAIEFSCKLVWHRSMR